jgi:hypothetical protein
MTKKDKDKWAVDIWEKRREENKREER